MPQRERGKLRRGDEGAVTAETAVALPALVIVMGAVVWSIAVVAAQLQCVDAARAGARAVARGEPIEVVRAVVATALPKGAEIAISPGEELTRVRVSLSVQPLGTAVLPRIQVTSSAVAATEPGARDMSRPGDGLSR